LTRELPQESVAGALSRGIAVAGERHEKTTSHFQASRTDCALREEDSEAFKNSLSCGHHRGQQNVQNK